MMTEPDFASVGMLIPARIHHAREQVMALLRAELSTDIATLATDRDAPHAGDDPDQFMLWASSMILSLPTRSHGDDNGNR